MTFLLVWMTPEDPAALDALQGKLHEVAGVHCVPVDPTSLLARILPGQRLEIRPAGSLTENYSRSKAQVIRDALIEAGGNRTEAARLAGVHVKTVHNHIRRHPQLFVDLASTRR